MNSFIHSYLLANLLLGISFLVFSVAIYCMKSYRVNLLRTAQFLVLASVLLGAVSPYLPMGQLAGFYPRSGQEKISEISLLEGPDGDFLSPIRNKIQKPNRPSEMTESNSTFDVMNHILLGLFVAGFLIALCRQLFGIMSLLRLLKASVLFKKFGRTEILVSDRIEVPFATRLQLSAQVVIPVQFLGSKKDLRIAIQHEIQHHRNGDTQWVLGMECLKLLFFANPFIYLWRTKIDELLEFSCDEALVIHGRVSARDYGSCLLKVAETLISHPRSPLGVTSMAVGSWKSSAGMTLLQSRIDKLFFYERSGRHFKSFLDKPSLGLITMCSFPLLVFTVLTGGKTEASLTLNLHVDSTIQTITNLAVSQGAKQSAAMSAYAVVSDPNTGQVLAVSYFDGRQNKSVSIEDAEKAVFGKVIQPNSLMKPILAAYALDREKIKVEEKLNGENGFYQVGSQSYQDSQHYSSLTPAEVVIFSSNIGGIKIAEKLGASGLTHAMEEFGIGKGGSSSFLPGQSSHLAGQVPTLTSNVPESVADFAMGRNTYFSPIEVVQAYGAMINGGKLFRPQSTNSNQNNQKLNIPMIRQVISANTSTLIKNALGKAVSEGTGTNAQVPLYTSGGKTGTGFAYVGENNEYIKKYGTAHFVGFAPLDNPQVVIYVVVEGPKDSGYGNTHAAPIFGKIAEAVLGYLKVAPDRLPADYRQKEA